MSSTFSIISVRSSDDRRCSVVGRGCPASDNNTTSLQHFLRNHDGTLLAIPVRIVDTLFQDFKYALRTLTRSGVTTFVIVGTLALAMGTSAVMFTVAETILQSVP